MSITIVIGWFTLLGVVAGALIPVVQVILIYAKFREALAHGEHAPRAEVYAVFQLQGVMDLYTQKDWVDETGCRHRNWLHRLVTLTGVLSGPALLFGGVGFLLDNLLPFFI